MKILLTGQPGVGKSTLIQKFIADFSGEKYGLVINRMRDESGYNQGFEAVSVDGQKKIIAHRSLVKSDLVVGNGHNVDLAAIDTFVVTQIQKGLDKPDSIIIIDEIGRMQAFSSKFLQAVSQVINSEANILATIVSDPEPWSLPFKENPQVIMVEVTTGNRHELLEILLNIYNGLTNDRKLSAKQQEAVTQLTKNYFKTDKYLQINKLFKNSIPYLIQDKVKEITLNKKYQVNGNTNQHLIEIDNGDYNCDCDLFKGEKQFAGKAGECSHIQAVKLFCL